ncbi:MAG: dolichol-phosphate mannosyltransferase [Halieaceae bacterium]
MSVKKSITELAVIIPVYNESSCIEKVANEWRSAFVFKKIKFKIIFINDGSTDNTAEILERVSKEYPEIVLISQVNGGHGNAVLNGYEEALRLNADYVFQVDSDDQFLPSDFGQLWNERESSPFVLGFREKRNDPRMRLIITKTLKYFLRLICKTSIRDANIPYRLIESNFLRSALKNIPADAFAPNIFLAVLSSRYLFSYPEIPVTHVERQTGEVSIVRMGLLKACLRSFIQLVTFSLQLDKKVSAMQSELESTEIPETKKNYA